MSSVVISGDTSGAITLQAPAVSGNTTLNLPASSGTVLTQNSSAPANSFVVDASGNVGIGTSSPNSKLTVAGNTEIRSSSGVYFGDSTNVSFPSIYSPSINNIAFRLNSGSETMRIDSSGNLLFNSGYGSVATAYGCRAWVNFNGTGTVAIRASGNVTSITDNGVGDYTVNFTTAMPDANYSSTVTSNSGSPSAAGNYVFMPLGYVANTSSYRFNSGHTGSAYIDCASINVAIFR